ncbi:MAG TPA: hypothetical protein VHD56_11805 [Tepidisphaeraceae bacterium]|nr:hypothetical protein [Tepidisphaeraceae bacterium]
MTKPRLEIGHWCLVIVALLAIGCHSEPKADVPVKPIVALTRVSTMAPDAPEVLPVIFHVDIFLLSLPKGSYSANEDFWKRIDENCVDPATSDLLYKNGMRIGVARNTEIEHFAKFITDLVPKQKFSLTAPEIKEMEFDLKTGLPSQTLFHFDRTNTVIGRSFDGCDNLLRVSFEPAMRKPGQLRMTICPAVRALRKKLEYTERNNEMEFQTVTPEAIYDLNCRADIPPDSFLIITPSPDAARPTSIGHAFFMKQAAAEELEQIVLVIPKPIKNETKVAMGK